MRVSSWLALILLSTAAALTALAIAGRVQAVTAGVLGVLCVIASVPLLVWSRIQSGLDRDAARVRELPERGVRVRGQVLDALPFTSPTGGAVFQAGGAQMVLQVALDRGEGRRQTVTVHVVEPSEAARARIGTEVTVLEHPDDPGLRALSGYLPNGRRA